jgi:hypothetical protein
MKEIYDSFVQDTMYAVSSFDDPVVRWEGKKYLVGKASDRVVLDNLIQKAPFNFLDGVWLQNIVSARPSDAVMSKLFDIWADEAGNGEVEQNHANVYDNLLRGHGIYLPSVSSREFIDYPFVAGAWRTAVFQACVGMFPQEFLPELLGMTLYIEWEATPTLSPTVRMLRGRRINPLFYQLHVAIDNISEGHGALAKEAVKAFLEEQRQEGGDTEVQRNWKRIWNGYVTWATAGFLALERVRRRLIIDKKRINVGTPEKPECFPDIAGHYKEQMIKLVQRKAPYAGQVHGGVVVGGKPLNSLFATPDLLLELLIKDGLVDPKHPRDSRLVELMRFDGPMYRVFSEAEQEVVLDWIESLEEAPYECIEPLPDTPAGDLPAKMAQVIVSHAAVAKLVHGGIVLTTMDGQQRPLAELFDTPAQLTGALKVCGWVVAGNPNRSFFLTRILQNGGPMENVLPDADVATVREWIRAGAELPTGGIPLPSEAAGADDGLRKAQSDFAAAREFIGMGAVH